MVSVAPVWRILPVVLPLLLPPMASAASSLARPTSAPPPSWVEPVPLPEGGVAPSNEISGGIWYRLWDRQVRVAGPSHESFSRITRQIVNDAGLDQASQISLDFDPAYQKLTFHWVRINRDGRLLDRLSLPKVEVIQRETELESQVFDGRMSAVVFLEDLRVGDLIDYAYSISGHNPVLGQAYSTSFGMDASVPVQHLSFRLLWPSSRQLSIKNHGTNIAPVSRQLGGFSELTWAVRDSMPTVVEGALPPSYDPWAWVQVSEYESWQQVAAWGDALFASVPQKLPVELENKVREWQAATPDRDAQAILATRFVQDEVRYLGFEMGEGSHRPSSPEIVFRRRFGDCKDKALLLSTLLRQLGIEARPALVSTSVGFRLEDWLPTPLAFNHVVVVVEQDGRNIWIDATSSGQGGDLDHIQPPALGSGLLLDRATTELRQIPTPRLTSPSMVSTSTFTSKDFESPVDLVIETRHEGRDADHIRGELLQTSRADLGKSYVKFYGKTWPNIRAIGLPESRDDREKNVLILREHYSIPGFWTKPPSGSHRPKAEIYPLVILGMVPGPVPNDRFMPMGLGHPTRVREVTTIELPEDWGLESASETIADSAMKLVFQAQYTPNRLSVSYEYETLKDTIPAADIEAHRVLRRELGDRLGYAVGGPPPAPKGGANWTIIALLTTTVMLAVVAIVMFVRSFATPLQLIADPAQSGFGGWLILVGFVVLTLPVRFALRIHEFPYVWSLSDWVSRTTPGGDDFHPLWTPYLIAGVLGNAALLCAALALAILFVRRNAAFPAALVAFLGLNALVLLATGWLAPSLPGIDLVAFDAVAAAAGDLLIPSALVPYLFNSDRARSTFVR